MVIPNIACASTPAMTRWAVTPTYKDGSSGEAFIACKNGKMRIIQGSVKAGWSVNLFEMPADFMPVAIKTQILGVAVANGNAVTLVIEKGTRVVSMSKDKRTGGNVPQGTEFFYSLAWIVD